MIEPIEKRIVLNAAVSRVWKAITDPAELGKWMLMPTDFEAVPGRDFTFKAESSEKWDGIIYCTVKEIEENKKLVFTWNAAMANAETVVSIELKEVGDKTELTLIHSGWDKLPANKEEMRKAHNEGWELRIMHKLQEHLNI